ncbi:MAG: DUF494 family protein [Candidatus Riflebacteria bacterium]|nr:DUF494 family protein [Candidatus Riflebacteria bacterium]
MNKARSSIGNIVKIMKMVVQQIENLKEGKEEPSLNPPMVEKLIKRGFSPEDVSLAMSWLALLGITLKEPSHSNLPPDNHPLGLRQLHPSESLRLSPDAQGLLLNLLNNCQVSPEQFERFIEFIWQNDLRDVSPLRMEVLLNLGTPIVSTDPIFLMSNKVPPPTYIH